MISPLKKKGFQQFLIRTGILLGTLFMLQFSIFLFFSKTFFFNTYLKIPQEFYFDLLTGLNKQNVVSAGIFVVIAFILWRRKDILNFEPYKQNFKESMYFGVAALSVFAFHYLFKYWINANLEPALGIASFLATIKVGINLFFVFLLALAVFNSKFIFTFMREFRKDIIIFSLLMVIYYNIIWWFQNSWFFFSSLVGKSLGFVLPFFFDDVVVKLPSDSGPILGVEGFYVAISKVCSGIDSLLFFISLFIILVITNWDNLDRKRMALLFIPGVIGAYLLNFIRVFLLLVIAVKISPEFAVDTFHTNAGWIFFLGYFILFWHFGSKWVLKK